MDLKQSAFAALIAGVVSLVISVVTTYLTARAARQHFEKEVGEKYRQKLYELRLKEYPTAFAITGQIVFDRELQTSPEELHKVYRELRTWWVGPAAPLLSKHSVGTYFELERQLKAFARQNSEPNAADELDDSDLFAANRAFRLTLRQDLDVLYDGNEFSDSLRREDS